MTPKQLAKSGSEHGEQTALFCFVAMACKRGFEAANDLQTYTSFDYAEKRYSGASGVPELAFYHAIPNGGSRGDTKQTAMIAGGKLKAEGVKPGVSDTCWPLKRGEYSGIYIEMKKPALKPKKVDSKGGVSEDQETFGKFVQSQGFGFVVCYSWREAADVLMEYYNHGK